MKRSDIYIRHGSISEIDRSQIFKEVQGNDVLFDSVKVSFGSYPSVSNDRKIIALRTFSAEYEGRRCPTQSIEDLDSVGQWLPNSSHFPYTTNFIQTLGSSLGSRAFGKVLVARVPPGSGVNWHTDAYPSHSGFIRVHVPIVTCPKASTFFTEKGDFEMEQGGIYLYDSQPMHRVQNLGISDRIHLIVDLLLEREKYFPKVFYTFDRIEFEPFGDQEDLKNFNFEDDKKWQETMRKYATLILFYSVSIDKSGSVYANILWNSDASRDKFYEDFNLPDRFSQFGVIKSIESKPLWWRESYQQMRELGSTYILICRGDYRW